MARAMPKPMPRVPPVTSAVSMKSAPCSFYNTGSMSIVAILGAGDLGGAIAQALMVRGRVRDLRLVDDSANVAAGKALDLLQSSPIDRVDVRIDAAADPLAAAGAKVIVLADPAGTGEWQGESGLALVERLLRAGSQATFVFAGAKQVSLMTTAVRE